MTIQAHLAASGAEPSISDPSSTTSVTKALRLLDVFRNEGPVLGVSELARQAGVAKSTAFRLLGLLEDAELVERDGTGYRLAWRVFELGTSVQRRWPRGLRESAAPWLTEVFVKSGGVVHLGVLDGSHVLLLDKVTGPRAPKVSTSVGGRLPVTCTALGKALLATASVAEFDDVVASGLTRRTAYSLCEPGRLRTDLERTRVAGFASEREELALGLASVAAAVIVGRNVVAAVSVSGPSARFDFVNNGALVRGAARRIAMDLGADSVADASLAGF